jgi:hypothetical protein
MAEVYAADHDNLPKTMWGPFNAVALFYLKINLIYLKIDDVMEYSDLTCTNVAYTSTTFNLN